MGQDEKVDTVVTPKRKKLILTRTELPLSGKSVDDVKKGVTEKYQYWINYPMCITNNVFRVVQSDSETHYVDGNNASYCTRYKCGPVGNNRPGVSFFQNVHKDVTRNAFCFFAKTIKRQHVVVLWVCCLATDLTYLPSPLMVWEHSE